MPRDRYGSAQNSEKLNLLIADLLRVAMWHAKALAVCTCAGLCERLSDVSLCCPPEDPYSGLRRAWPGAARRPTEVCDQDDGAACGADVLAAEPITRQTCGGEHLHRAGSERSVTWLIGALQDPAGGSCEGYVGTRVWSWTCNVPLVCAVAACRLCRPVCLSLASGSCQRTILY